MKNMISKTSSLLYYCSLTKPGSVFVCCKLKPTEMSAAKELRQSGKAFIILITKSM